MRGFGTLCGVLVSSIATICTFGVAYASLELSVSLCGSQNPADVHLSKCVLTYVREPPQAGASLVPLHIVSGWNGINFTSILDYKATDSSMSSTGVVSITFSTFEIALLFRIPAHSLHLHCRHSTIPHPPQMKRSGHCQLAHPSRHSKLSSSFYDCCRLQDSFPRQTFSSVRCHESVHSFTVQHNYSMSPGDGLSRPAPRRFFGGKASAPASCRQQKT